MSIYLILLEVCPKVGWEAAGMGNDKFKQSSRRKAFPRYYKRLLIVTGLAVALSLVLKLRLGGDSHHPSSITVTAEVFSPTIPSSTHPDSAAPEGMVWITGGEFSMG